MIAMFSDPDTRKAILVGIVASTLFLIFVQPLLTLGGRLILDGSDALSYRLSAYLYRRAAGGPDNSTAALFVLASVSTIWFLVGVVLWRGSAQIKRGSESVHHPAEANNRRSMLLRAFWRLHSILAFVLAVGLFGIATIDSLMHRLNRTFQQRMAIVRPVVGDDEAKHIFAAWASMENRRDYERVNAVIEGYARERGIRKLPAMY